jgi:hypothetical protein
MLRYVVFVFFVAIPQILLGKPQVEGSAMLMPLGPLAQAASRNPLASGPD